MTTTVDIATKLAKISEIMSDGAQFVKMRFLLEDMAKDADDGDEAAEKVLEIVTHFHNLCSYVERS